MPNKAISDMLKFEQDYRKMLEQFEGMKELDSKTFVEIPQPQI